MQFELLKAFPEVNCRLTLIPMRFEYLVLFITLLSGCSTAKPALDNPWGKTTTIYPSHAESIGSYSAGCLKGAVSLPPDSAGFLVMHPSRRRYYGHPSLVEFIKDLGKEVTDKKLGVLLLGDLGQPRGGPMPNGHASHQIGLDVDIWYWEPDFIGARTLTLDERENIASVSMVDTGNQKIDITKWQNRNTRILEIVSKNDLVERIFVNPIIKRDLCQSVKDHSWLNKLRPWWGHDDHFHVRLRCPAESAGCAKQDAIPEGDGCGKDLDWWFGEEAKAKAKEHAAPGPGVMPKLPDACAEVVGYP
jgi:penicillin-insensitive murein endopeptidase